MLLITGITGHSGSYLLEELINNKYESAIRCIVRNSSDTSALDNSGLNFEKVVGDLNDLDFMNKVMVDIDVVLHIASIFCSETVIKASAKNNVKKVILVHTTGIFSKYKSASYDYKRIEYKVNKIAKKFSINVLYLRPTMIYGCINDKNMMVFIRLVDKLRIFPIINHGENLLQPVSGCDLGKAYYQVLNNSNIISGDYILSGEKPISMIYMFKLISDNLGKKTYFISVPLYIGVFLARCLKICTFGKIDYIEKVKRMGEDRNFLHDDAARDFRYKPMPFEEGIKIEVKQYLERFKG